MKKKLLVSLTAMLAVVGLAFAATEGFDATKWWGDYGDALSTTPGSVKSSSITAQQYKNIAFAVAAYGELVKDNDDLAAVIALTECTFTADELANQAYLLGLVNPTAAKSAVNALKDQIDGIVAAEKGADDRATLENLMNLLGDEDKTNPTEIQWGAVKADFPAFAKVYDELVAKVRDALLYVEADEWVNKVNTFTDTTNKALVTPLKEEGEALTKQTADVATALETIEGWLTDIAAAEDLANFNAATNAYSKLVDMKKVGELVLGTGDFQILDVTGSAYATLKEFADAWTALKGAELEAEGADMTTAGTKSARDLVKAYTLANIQEWLGIYNNMADAVVELGQLNKDLTTVTAMADANTPYNFAATDYQPLYTDNENITAVTSDADVQNKTVLDYINQVYPAATRTTLIANAAVAYKQQFKADFGSKGATQFEKDHAILVRGVSPVDAVTGPFVTQAAESDLIAINQAISDYNDLYYIEDGVWKTKLSNLSWEKKDENGNVIDGEGLGLIDDETLANYTIEKMGECVQTYIKSRMMRAALSELLKNANIDKEATALYNAYNAAYGTLIAKKGEPEYEVVSSDAEKLENALNDIARLGIAGMRDNEHLYMVVFWKWENDAFEKITEKPEGWVLDNNAKAVYQKAQRKLIDEVKADLEAKKKAADWMAEWENHNPSAAGLTDGWNILGELDMAVATDKANLEAAYLAYAGDEHATPALAGLSVDAKNYINYAIYFAQLDDIVPVEKVTRVQYFSNGIPVDKDGKSLAEAENKFAYDNDVADNEVPSSFTAITENLAKIKVTVFQSQEMREVVDENAIVVLWGSSLSHDDFRSQLPANVVYCSGSNPTALYADTINLNYTTPYKLLLPIHARTVNLSRSNAAGANYVGFYAPFDIDVKTLNDAGHTAYYISGALLDNTKSTPTVRFGLTEKKGDDNTLYAYKPYIVKKSGTDNAEKTVTFTAADDSTIELKAGGTTAEEPVVCDIAGKVQFNILSSTQMVQTKNIVDLYNGDDYNRYYINGGQMKYMPEGVEDAKAMRNPATLIIDHVTLTPSAPYYIGRFFVEGEDDDVTAIDAVETVDEENTGIYSIDGVKVGNMNKSGLYIVNGKKVMVK